MAKTGDNCNEHQFSASPFTKPLLMHAPTAKIDDNLFRDLTEFCSLAFHRVLGALQAPKEK